FGTASATRYVKDAFHSYLVSGDRNAVNPEEVGTKAAAHYELAVGPGEEKAIRLRLMKTVPLDRSKLSSMQAGQSGDEFEELVDTRRREADAFYDSITPPSFNQDQARIMRQALSGMLWTKQYYLFDVAQWLQEHHVDFLSSRPRNYRDREWFHMHNDDIISMP